MQVSDIASEQPEAFKALVDAVENYINRSTVEQLRDFDFEPDEPQPLTAEQVLFCSAELGAMGCSYYEIERFFDDLISGSPYWFRNFATEAAERNDQAAFLFDVCEAFVDSITPVDEYLRLNGNLFHYQRDEEGNELTSCIGAQNNELVALVAYPEEVRQVKSFVLAGQL